MPIQRRNPEIPEQPRSPVGLDNHPDRLEVAHDRVEALASKAKGTAAQHRIAEPPPLMEKWRRRGLGAYLVVLGLALLAVIPWAWSFASRVVDAKAGTTVRAHFLGAAFTPTGEFSLVLIVMLTALMGSVAVLAMTFSSRAGHETLERGYVWWYLTRPISAAGLGLLFYMTVTAGFFTATTSTDRPALVLAAAIGGLAGLFTDQVLKKMRTVLGLLPTHTRASGKNDTPAPV